MTVARPGARKDTRHSEIRGLRTVNLNELLKQPK
jgi:hypothetical protein